MFTKRVTVGLTALFFTAGCAGAAFGPSTPTNVLAGENEFAARPAVESSVVYVPYPAKNVIEIFPASGTTPIKKIAGLKKPVDAVTNASGDLYVADAENSSIDEYKAGGDSLDATISTIGRPTALAVDASGDLYVSSAEEKTVSEYVFDAKHEDLADKPSRTIQTGSVEPDGIALDDAGNIFIADPKGDSVWVVAPKAKAPKLHLRLSGSADGVAVEGSGKQETLFVGSSTGGAVETFVGGSTKANKHISKGLTHPGLLTLASDGKLFVADSGGSGLVVVYAKGAAIPSEKISGDGVPGGVAVGAITRVTPTPSPTPYTGAILYVAENGSGAIAEYPVASGSPKPLGKLTNDLSHPNMLAVDGNRNLFVQDDGLAILLEFPKGKKEAVPAHVPDAYGCANGCGFTLDASNNIWVSGSATASGKTYASVNEYAYQSASQAWSQIGSVVGLNGLGATFQGVNNVAVDASGNTFVVDSNTSHVYVNSYGASTLTGLTTASQVALNAGRLYVSTAAGGSSQIVAYSAAQVVTNALSGTPTAPVETIDLPSGSGVNGSGIAFDDKGDLFVADNENSCVYGFSAAAIGASATGYPTVTPTAFETLCGLASSPSGVAVAPRGSVVAPSSSPSPPPTASPTSSPTSNPLTANPTSIVFTFDAAQTFSAQESGYTGTLTATSSNTSVATVSPSSGSGPSATFSVTPVGGGTCTIAVQDTQGNTVDVGITVNAGVIIIDTSHVKSGHRGLR